MKTFRERLEAAREAAGKTQTEVAKAIGISQPTYSALESEKGRSERTAYIVEIAIFLRVNPIWLATGRGQRELNAAHVDPRFVVSDPEEQVMLLDFRRATDKGRRKARAALLDNIEEKISLAGQSAKRMSP